MYYYFLVKCNPLFTDMFGLLPIRPCHNFRSAIVLGSGVNDKDESNKKILSNVKKLIFDSPTYPSILIEAKPWVSSGVASPTREVWISYN